MLEERAHEGGMLADVGQLVMHTFLQGLAFLQGPACVAGTLGVAPHQFVRIQVWSIARQEMQRQLALRAGDIGLDHRLLVGRQSVDHQVQWLPAAVHQLPEQVHKQLAVQCPGVDGEPEATLHADGRRRTDTLPLPGHRDHRGAPLGALSPALHGVGTKAGFVPKENVCFLFPGAPPQRRVGLALPALNCRRIALVSALQRLLHRQA